MSTTTDDLRQRVELLGRLVLRGDVERWIRDLDAAGPARRAELLADATSRARRPAASLRSDHHEPRRTANGPDSWAAQFVLLIALVEDYGGARVLEAVADVAQRLRREHFGLERTAP
jgi:hypothetical protein